MPDLDMIMHLLETAILELPEDQLRHARDTYADILAKIDIQLDLLQDTP
jgi:hypothetical protein